MKSFGIGQLVWAMPDGTLITFGTLQNITNDISFEVKELYGRNQFPDDVARGKGKIALKASAGEIRAGAFNAVLSGTLTTGMLKVLDPPGTGVIPGSSTIGSAVVTAAIPSSSAYTLAVALPTGASSVTVDNGCYLEVGGVKIGMTSVASAGLLASGKYLFSAGVSAVYTFHSSNAGGIVDYGFTYALSSASAAAATIQSTLPSGGVAITADLGVFNVTNSLVAVPMVPVSSAGAVAQGKYYLNKTTGLYTFSTADAGQSVQWLFQYSLTTGNTVTVTNQPMGLSPTFSVYCFTGQPGGNVGQLAQKYNKCTSTKIGMNAKNDDYLIPDFEFSAFSDAAGNVFTLYCDD